jgi:hypothetical protein
VKILPPSFNKQMHIVQQDRLKWVSQLAGRHSVILDFSDSSLASVETLLKKMAEAYAAEGVKGGDLRSNQGAIDACETLGFYVVECIERNYRKGSWVERNPNTGKPQLCFKVKGRTIVPAEWAMDALVGDSSIWHTYSAFVTA